MSKKARIRKFRRKRMMQRATQPLTEVQFNAIGMNSESTYVEYLQQFSQKMSRK